MNENEADIKRAYHKPHLIIGLVMIMVFSHMWGESSDYTPKLNYKYNIPGLTEIFANSPKGFTRGYQQPYQPVSINFPQWFSNIEMNQDIGDSGNVLIMSEQIDGKDLYSPRYIPFSEYFMFKKSYNLDRMWYNRVSLTDSSFYLDPLDQQNQDGQSLEIIGADIAGQRVALRIRGVISITGKYNQQNNSLMATGNMDNEQNNFLMDQTQQFTIEGTIGDRITISIDEDSERDFDFENAIKINYKGKEDEIVQSANFGNIGLSLPGTQFITGSASSSGLFGGKAVMKLGPIDVTAIASYERKDSKKKSWGGGSGDDGGSTIKIFDHEYKRNTYYYIDESYRESMYPIDYQNGKFPYDPNNEIISWKLYVSCNDRVDVKQKAIAFVDIADDGTPTRVSENAEEDVADSIYFRLLEPSTQENPYGDYSLNMQLGYIRMNMGLGDDNILAIAYITRDGKEYGDINTGQFLKIIKAENPKPSYVTWDLEMKNIYDLKARNIEEDGFDLKIFINDNNPREFHNSGVPYLTFFDLDNYDQSGTYKNSDGKVDIVPEGVFVDLAAGELWLPYARPFQNVQEGSTIEGIYNPNLGPADDDDLPSAEKIYTLPYTDDKRKEGKYYIEVTYTNRSSTIDLGEMFIIEGSEEVVINGSKMESGVDYDIEYFSGIITLKSARAMDPDAKIEINYDTEQLFGGIGEQKLMAGMRAEYQISEKAFIGATAMYYNRSVLDDKNVNIGDEPFSNFIWDVNGEFEYDLDWLDRAMNALPFIRVKQPSQIKVNAEIAQILPNPNTINNEESGDFNGVAKLDDFESASQETPMNINFQKWFHASKPTNTFFSSSFKERGFLFWYNPFYGTDNNKVFGIYTKDIWPNKETTETDQYTNILKVVLDPEVNGITGLETQNDVRQVWGGIMQPVYMYDQSKSKYIELWVKGDKGQLQIDIGEISEDWYDINYDAALPEGGDGEKNYEDKDLDGTLDVDTTAFNEDVGINGLTDEEEIARGWDPLIDNFNEEEYDNNEVRYCNGSENNSAINLYPETEDIDRDGKLDQTNSYYSYTLDLSSDEWLISKTSFSNNKPTGWKKYQIPLTAMIDSVGKPSFQSIRMMRLNVFGMEDQDTLQFASISIVGNEWQEIGLAEETSTHYTIDDDRFSISVKNSDEDDDYISPPGITGREIVDPLGTATITAKEQSLVLNLVDLRPGETALAEKIMLENESLLMYKKLKMFVHGDDGLISEPSPINLFLRLGRGDMTEYYEAVTEVYDGWDSLNHIEMIFDEITQLKIMTEFDGREFFSYDNGNIREYRPIDPTTGEYTGKIFRVVGNPSLSRVERMQLGVINVDPDFVYSGDIWVNEMRVVESNNDPGMAMRGSVDLKLGGMLRVNFNGKKTDADFRQVNQQMSSNLSTSENFNINATISANKIFPDKWNLKFPITMSQKQTTTTPKYYPGSDILIGTSPDDSLKKITHSQSINTSLNRTGNKADPLLTRLLVNPISASFNATRSQNSSLETASEDNISYNSNFQYSLSLDKGKGIAYLGWIPFLSDKAKEDRFYWKPKSFKWTMNMTQSEKDRVTRTTMDTISTDRFFMKKNMSVTFAPFSTLDINYSRSSTSDLLNYMDDFWGIFSDLTYDSLMNGVNVGDVTNMTENLKVNYDPQLTPWLKPKLQYNSNYSYKAQKGQYYAGVNVGRTYSANFSLSLKEIWETYEKKFNDIFAKPDPVSSKPESKPAKIQKPDFEGRTAPPPEKQTQPRKNPRAGKKRVTVADLLGRVNPIRFTYTDNLSKTNSGVTGSDTTKIYKDVRYLYRYGFGDYYYLPTGTFEGNQGNPNSNDHRINFSISSGLKLTRAISMTFSYKQNTTSGPQYQFKSSSDDYYDANSDIIAYGDTLELIRSDSSSSRGYLPLGETGQDGFPIPDYSISWRINPSQYKWLKGKLDFIKGINLQHQMSGKESSRYTLRTDSQPYYMESSSSTYTLNFSPLIRADFTFKGNLKANVGFSKSITIDHQGDTEIDYLNTNIIRKYQDNITLSVQYNYNKGISIPVPFLKKIKVINMKNEISFSLQGKYGMNKKIIKAKGDMDFGDPKDHKINWEIEPQVTYRFSKNIDGRLFFKYGQRHDLKNQFSPDGSRKFDDYKDFGLTVTIRISG